MSAPRKPLAVDVWPESSLGPFQTHPGSLHHLPQLQTYIGNVLVSVNPYQQLPIYDLEFVAKYPDYTFYELKPHM